MNQEIKAVIPSKSDVESSPDDEFLTSIEFLEAGEEEPKITEEMAQIELKKMLKGWKVLRKAIKKGKSGKKNKANRDEFEESWDQVLNAIMYGQLVINGDPIRGITITHKLLDPPGGYDELHYKRIPKLVDLRKIDEFTDQESIAQTQALAAAMSGKATAELVGLSAADLDVLGALAYFFV